MKQIMRTNKKNLDGIIRGNVGFEDFLNVFLVFCGSPFFEYWTTEMVLDVYNSFNVKDGFIFGYYLNNKCVGILTLRPIIPSEHPVSFPINSKTMYLSDVATLPEYRGMRIGTQLFMYGIQHTKVLGYDNIYLRTNEKEISMSYLIAEKCGFSEIKGVSQDVEFPRINSDIPTTDRRIFMTMKL